jgi:dihydrofolate reductase
MISIIVAYDERNVIGRDNYIPWKIPSDLKRFKRITTGHTVVMGRKTYTSIGQPLPNRTNIVITSSTNISEDKVIKIANSCEEAFLILDHSKENFIIGGSSIYEYFLPLTDRLYISKIHANVGGTIYFPKFQEDQYKIIEQIYVEDVLDDYPYTFSILERM